MTVVEYKNRTYFRNKFIKPLYELGILRMSQPDKPQSSKQKYGLTEKGLQLLKFVKEYYNI